MTATPRLSFDRSNELQARFNALIPGGAHTYAKGDDQYPEAMAPYIVRGSGCRVWDLDGNEFIEYGSGLRSVGLGHAFPAVVAAAQAQLAMGANFVRPAPIELEAAELLQSMIPTAEMVKFCKDGSDATTGAVKLARAYTGRDLVAVCGSQPFFSVDDWFIGVSPMPAGIPETTRAKTLSFAFNDLASLEEVFATHPNTVAAVILEAEKDTPPAEGFLAGVRAACDRAGAVLILDEMITGFRWDTGGAQRYFGMAPDLSTFGKALGNGLSVSALVGRRELMRLGGAEHDRERVFLLSTTHGAETHGLAGTIATMRTYLDEPVIETLWERGRRLGDGLRQVIASRQLTDYIPILGPPCCLLFGTRGADGRPSQPFRTLLLQELLDRGVLAPSLVVNFSHSESDIDQTIAAFDGALDAYARGLENGVAGQLRGRPVQPAIRPRG